MKEQLRDMEDKNRNSKLRELGKWKKATIPRCKS